jgi:Ni,Fe-hydrogenase III large subunit
VPLRKWIEKSTPLPGTPGARRLPVTAEDWNGCARDVAAAGGRLLALWTQADPPAARTVFIAGKLLLQLELDLPAANAAYPGLAELFPSAARMQRAAADLTGARAREEDQRPWLRHTAWPADYLPLSGTTAPLPTTPVPDDYAFVRVAGEGVHEIPVGPVHAGIIEPGHFRFSVVGEKVLKLEARFGYVHKGIEQRLEGMPALEGHRIAARVCGDSTVAYSWAYCQALEGIAGVIPPRATWLRALALECERTANHLGDLGALGNDAGFAFGLAQLSRLKELWLRAMEAALGQRYLFDFIVPGGVNRDVDEAGLRELLDCIGTIERESAGIRLIFDEHPGVRDRFTAAGIVTPALAATLGLCGLAGRASGQAHDLRTDLPCPPYDELPVHKVVLTGGDVAARVTTRFEELKESLRLVRDIVRRLPAGDCRVTLVAMPGQGVGLVEGWRGPVLVALSVAVDGRIDRCHPHDPSWQNWPVLEHAVIGNIVPDFPLINKSFNLAYSGHDL